MQTVLIVIGVLIVALFAFRAVAMAKIKKTPLVPDHKNIITLTDKNFVSKTKNKTVLVDFWASWCAPCRVMAPVLNEMAEELGDDAEVGKVDIQQYQNLASQFKVRSIPTMVVFKNGKEVKRFVGIKSKDYLMRELAKIG